MRTAMRKPCPTVAALVAVLALAGCSSSSLPSLPGLGSSKPAQPTPTVDMNVYPANYRRQIVVMLLTLLSNRADFLNATIAQPALKPVVDSANLHYVVCIQYNDRTEHRDKAVIYLGGEPQQYIDATPQQCGDAAYQPFTELAAALPHKS